MENDEFKMDNGDSKKLQNTLQAIPHSPSMKGIPAYSLLVKVWGRVLQVCLLDKLRVMGGGGGGVPGFCEKS